jgi:hypothetical protein
VEGLEQEMNTTKMMMRLLLPLAMMLLLLKRMVPMMMMMMMMMMRMRMRMRRRRRVKVVGAVGAGYRAEHHALRAKEWAICAASGCELQSSCDGRLHLNGRSSEDAACCCCCCRLLLLQRTRLLAEFKKNQK